MRRLFILVPALLAACATPQQRAESVAAYINANYGSVCESLGYTRGSDKYRDCMVAMFNADEIRAGQALYGTCWGGPGWCRPW